MLSASCAGTAHLVKQASILAVVAKQQWVGPIISLIGFQVFWQLHWTNVSNIFDIIYFWLPVVSKQLVLTLIIFLFCLFDPPVI